MIMAQCGRVEQSGPLAMQVYYVGQLRFSGFSFDCHKVGLQQKNIFFSFMPPSSAI